tara:strand:- start:110 stop:286 length:177 start_codon:yes stop_codon:yes gene_type:complete
MKFEATFYNGTWAEFTCEYKDTFNAIIKDKDYKTLEAIERRFNLGKEKEQLPKVANRR